MTLIAQHHWYISTDCTYPMTAVRQINLRHTAYHLSYELIEMTRKATLEEIQSCHLIYLGRGYSENETIMKKVTAFDELPNSDIAAMDSWRFVR